MAEKPARGLIQVYTGDGKGKTTAALGLAMRAAGHGMKIAFIQFLKGERCGEHLFVSRHHPFDIVQISVGSSFTKPEEQLGTEARQTLAYAEKEMLSGNYDLIILDEILVAVNLGLITTRQVLDLLEKKPDSLELVLTGRGAPPEIVQRADLVTEMRPVKHPFQEGIAARRGIEY
ncbi:cob(I)yrinic acid a,c-diamide adenosyltransferase [Chloroflexota bacterium]